MKINYAELSSNGDVRWEKAGRDDSLFAHLYGGDVTGPMVCDAIRLSRNNGWDSRVQQLAEDEWLV